MLIHPYQPDNLETFETSLTLVPMRAGNILFPNVIVSLMPSDQDADGVAGFGQNQQQQQQRQSPLTCETYVENAAEVVKVLPAKRSVTAVIPIQPNMGRVHSQWGPIPV